MNMLPYILLFLVATFSACGLLGSDGKEPLEPGPRNYEWRVDSVYSAPGGWMNAIWGSSPNDVWIGSAGGLDRLWHYNGIEWQKSSQRIPRSVNTIFGFAQNNIWMGTNGIIYHYDGNEWSPFYTYSPEGMGEPNVLDIWGSSPSDVYAVGTIPSEQGSYKGFILHYNGNRWEELLGTDDETQFQRVRKDNEGLIIRGSHRKAGKPRILSLFKFSNHKLETLLSKSSGAVKTLWMNNVGNEIYYIVNSDIQKLSNGKFETVISLMGQDNPIGINGRHGKDIFIVTENGITHYNGENYLSLFKLDNSNASVFRELVLENDVFFLVNDYDAGTNLIYHGTLSEEEE